MSDSEGTLPIDSEPAVAGSPDDDHSPHPKPPHPKPPHPDPPHPPHPKPPHPDPPHPKPPHPKPPHPDPHPCGCQAGPQGAKGEQGDTGPQGQAGADGQVGPQGGVGAEGDSGPQGAVGAEGAVGAQGGSGPQGNQGNVGPQGSVGQTGPAAVTFLLYAYSNAPQPASGTLTPGEAIVFSNAGPNVGFSTSDGGASWTVLNAANYIITFAIPLTVGGGITNADQVLFALFINGVLVPGSGASVADDDSLTLSLTKSVAIQLAAGDIIQVRYDVVGSPPTTANTQTILNAVGPSITISGGY